MSNLALVQSSNSAIPALMMDEREDERRQRTIEELRCKFEHIELKQAQKETLQ